MFGTLGGAALGWLGSAAVERRRDERQAKRDDQARRTEDERRLLQERREFQRQTLIELQEELARLARGAGRVHFLDKMAARSGAGYGSQQLPAEDNMAVFASNVRVRVLTGRLFDDHLQERVRHLREMFVGVSGCRTESDAEQQMSAALDLMEELDGQITQAFRTLF